MALDEQEEVREHLEEAEAAQGAYLDDRKQQVSLSSLLPSLSKQAADENLF